MLHIHRCVDIYIYIYIYLHTYVCATHIMYNIVYDYIAIVIRINLVSGIFIKLMEFT